MNPIRGGVMMLLAAVALFVINNVAAAGSNGVGMSEVGPIMSTGAVVVGLLGVFLLAIGLTRRS